MKTENTKTVTLNKIDQKTIMLCAVKNCYETLNYSRENALDYISKLQEHIDNGTAENYDFKRLAELQYELKCYDLIEETLIKLV